MQTFIIWIPSVICLMIHLPQVYGAAPSNSDNDEDPMEVDAHGSRKKVRARRVLGDRIHPPSNRPMPLQSRREIQPTTTHAASGKRKWEMQSSDLPQAKKLMQFKGDGTCGAVLTSDTEVDEDGIEIRVETCHLLFTEYAAVSYTTQTEKKSGETSRIVDVVCGEKLYIVEDGRIDAILMGEDMYDVGRDDPTKDFNNRAFGMGCLDIFHEVQRTLLPGSPVRDVLERDECTKIITQICNAYQSAADAPMQATQSRV
ncbi:hypothetical protein FOZ62_005475 [Perkinsus olseni]|uniref:Uncharacterized protein n=1 Tax=Perkinsus olseni TaxID=32597 RepID=A0A7J6MZB2_PEROL|nr:hypothetical protein FOZ62_005475 [Perkinsus olseni]